MSKKTHKLSDQHKALVKELGYHSHHPNLWMHLMNETEVKYVLDRIKHYNFPTRPIATEAIHIKSDGSDRITLIVKKPKDWEGENYGKWESIKNDVQKFRKGRKKELGEALKQLEVHKEMVPVPTPNDGVDPVWRRPRCEFCSRQDEFNKDLVASVVEVNGRILFGAQVYIEDNELKLYLDNSSNDFMQMDSVKIKYCPMCGRKFWHDKEKGMTNEEAKAHMDMLIAHKDNGIKGTW